jgi:anti-anti-sigma factor
MSFSATSEVTNGIGRIVLTGELDASVAPAFKAEIEKIANPQLRRLVLMVRDLEYMASAGLRVLVFAKQKLAGAVDIYIVGARPEIVDTLEMVGLHHSVILLAEYDAGRIEA